MELFPPAWRAVRPGVFLCLATAMLLSAGCGRQQVSVGDSNDQPAEVSKVETRPAPMTFQLAEHTEQIRRLPLPEIKRTEGPALVFSAPLASASPPIDVPLPAEDWEQFADADDAEAEDLGDFDEAYAPPFDIYREPLEQPVDVDEIASVLREDMPPSNGSPSRVFSTEEYDEDAEIAAKTTADDILSYFPAEAELSDQFRPKVQAAFTLARNGALHAARGRFESLLAELARAKDASQMTNRHSRALTAGLRALREADDFFVTGIDGEASAFTLAAGHQTPMLREPFVEQDEAKWTLSHEAIAMYHRYAERKLAAAIDGEQAGSMALYGLGKIYHQLGERRDDVPQALRKSLTMYRSALLAHPKNHLAANEAGVLLARAGRYDQSLPLLERASKLAPSSVTHKNLAYVYQKQGVAHLAQAHGRESEKMAASEKARGQLSADRGITWMSPQEFNRRSGGTGARAVTAGTRPAAPQPMTPQTTMPPVRSQVAAAPRLPSPNRAIAPSQPPPRLPAPQPTMWW